MKFAQIIFLLLIPISVFSQSKLDSLVLSEVNSYRKSKGLDTLIYSDINFKSANHHSNFLVKTNKVGHTEDTLVSVKDRVNFFGGKSPNIAENVSSVNINIKESDTLYLNKLAKEVVKSWINSKEHNRILLSKFKFVGVSCITTKRSTGIKGYTNFNVVSTLVLTN